MAEPARRQRPGDDAPRYDPLAIPRRLARERARRAARIAHKRRRRHAGVRFLVTIVILLGLIAFLGYAVRHEIGRLFGV